MKENTLTSQVRGTAQGVKEAAQEWTERAKGTAREWTDRAIGGARDAGTAADNYIRENVWTSVAIVAVAACVVGYLLGSSQRS